MRAVRILLQAVQPLLATSLQGDPNSSVSFSYIPGGLIRGALIGRYQAGKDSDMLADAEARRLFFDGTTRYLNAYLYAPDNSFQPTNERGRRTLPTPRSWVKNKGDELDDENKTITLYDRGQLDGADLDDEITPAPVGYDYCAIDGGSVTLYEVRRRIAIHTQRERGKGRATKEGGQLFRYDALESGQLFQAIVLCDRDEDAETIVALLERGDLWLGGSRSAGYGQTRVLDRDILETWREVANDKDDEEDEDGKGRPVDSVLTITLLSDMIVRDAYGQHAAQFPRAEIAEHLDLDDLPIEETQGEDFISSTTISSTITGGFNLKWGLPLPQTPALAAGSVFVCRVGQPIDQGRVLALEARGLGERRAEGFGRIAVNWPPAEDEFTAHKPDREAPDVEPPQAAPPNDADASEKLAKRMAERLLRLEMERKLIDQVGRLDLKPSLASSQLSRLAIVARRALTAASGRPSADPVRELLNKLPQNASRQYERARINGMSLKTQILAWLDKPDGWIVNAPSITVAGHTLPLSDELKLEYTLRLIIALAKKASKEVE